MQVPMFPGGICRASSAIHKLELFNELTTPWHGIAQMKLLLTPTHIVFWAPILWANKRFWVWFVWAIVITASAQFKPNTHSSWPLSTSTSRIHATHSGMFTMICTYRKIHMHIHAYIYTYTYTPILTENHTHSHLWTCQPDPQTSTKTTMYIQHGSSGPN